MLVIYVFVAIDTYSISVMSVYARAKVFHSLMYLYYGYYLIFDLDIFVFFRTSTT